MNRPVLGFVGLGRMGAPMSSHLVAAGYAVIGFDAAGTESRLPPGASAAASVAALAAQTDLALLSLPDGGASQSVCGEIARAPNRRVQTVIDLSTIGIPAARACAALLQNVEVTYVDAPVSGGVAGARAGSLSIMVGAPAEVLADLAPLFRAIGQNVFRLGDTPGMGQAMKLVNNYISAAALTATSEAVLLGARLGLDPAQMIDVINVSTGRTNASSDKFPKSILPETYDYGFTAAMMTKDVTLYLETAEATGVPRDVAAVVAGLWQRFSEACPGVDFTAIHRYLADRVAAATGR